MNMGFLDRFNKNKQKELQEREQAEREQAEKQAVIDRQRSEHASIKWPMIRPFSPVKVRDEKGNEHVPVVLADPLTPERKDEIGPMVFEPRISTDDIRFLNIQELIFLLTTMESFNKVSTLQDFEGNRRIVYNEIISRLRSSTQIWILIDLTTGYPFLDHGYALVYSQSEYAHSVAAVLASQYRRVNVQGFGGDGEPPVAGFFEFMYNMGAERLLLDNGYYGARIDRSQIMAPPNITGNENMPPLNPPLNFALCEFLSEVRWPVRYEKRDAILQAREAKMWSLIRSSHFIVPMHQEGRSETEGDGAGETRLRFPMMTGPDGKTYLPVFTDGPEFARKFAREGWNGASFQWKDLLSLIRERDGLIVNPMSHKAVLTKERIAQMETAAALSSGLKAE
ncbi:MAG: SseB family protein [Lachnospiraceae bacterium]|nr:SseB family protein [Lachnospiraceae bacterium]